MSVLRLKGRSTIRQIKQQRKLLSKSESDAATQNLKRTQFLSTKPSDVGNVSRFNKSCGFTWCHYRYYHQSRNAELSSYYEYEEEYHGNDQNFVNDHDTFIDFSDSQHHHKITEGLKISKSKLMRQNSFHYLYNLLEACCNASLLPDATDILVSHLKKNDPSVTEKTLDLYFYNLYQEDETSPHAIRLLLQTTFSHVLSSNVKLSPVSCCCIIATLGKVEKRNENIKALVVPMLDKYPLHEALEHLDKHSTIYKQAVHAARRCGIEIKNREIESHSVPHHPLVKKVYTSKASEVQQNVTNPCSMSVLQSQFDMQMKEELSGHVDVPNIMTKHHSDKIHKEKQRQLDNLKNTWKSSVVASFRQMKENEMERWSTKRGIYPYLCILPDEDYADIIINHLLNMPKTGEITTSASYYLGLAVFSRFTAVTALKSGEDKRLSEIYSKYADFCTSRRQNKLHRNVWNKLEKEHGKVEADFPIMPWHDSWKIYVGIKLLEVLVSATTFSIGRNSKVPSAFFKIPAVFNSYAYYGKRMFGMTIPHPLFTKIVSEASVNFKFSNSALPMMVPPKPWKSSLHGGFLLSPTDFVRTNPEELSDPRKTVFDSPQVYPLFDALNVLSSVAWKINTKILDLQIKIILANGDKSLDIPQPSSSAPPPPVLRHSADLTPEEEKQRRFQSYLALKAKKEMHSLHCDALYNLSIANKYRGKLFWFPHNLDFRGRAYPVPRHFNYMGSDVYRSLFLFGEGRPLGVKGLDWLKIHLTNLTGVKKRESTEARLAFADEMLDEIFDSANNPLTGRGWWKQFEERWQLLAACIELTSALRSPDPTTYISHLPIHQDGSCNGLQHYAAMGRDVMGAEQVNLRARDKPLDIYTKVAEEVEKLRAEAALEGNNVAVSLEGKINRKVVKQTVMTTVYGVTKFGAQLQVKKQLKEKFDELQNVLPASLYTTQLLLQSVKTMFKSASEIQDWLTEAATIISRGGQTVKWTTPLGLYASHPYFRTTTTKIKTNFQSVYLKEDSKIPNTIKQKNAFPPNFIHSLDSTHMMLTALYCYMSGINYNSIHDCYWTHACDVDHMNVLCREHFVKLHEQPLLHDLAEQFRKNYLPPDGVQEHPGYVSKSERERLSKLLTRLPAKGEFDLNEVKKSVYFFS